jgi:hypothetical protein
MSNRPQSFGNHTRRVPDYLAAGAILTFNVFWAAWRLGHDVSGDRAMALLVAVALVVLGLTARRFALRVQDRVIRLEMRLRLEKVLPPDQRARIAALTPAQLVALRFASDAELPELVGKVQQDNIQDKTAIKKMIKDWQPDYMRA